MKVFVYFGIGNTGVHIDIFKYFNLRKWTVFFSSKYIQSYQVSLIVISIDNSDVRNREAKEDASNPF